MSPCPEWLHILSWAIQLLFPVRGAEAIVFFATDRSSFIYGARLAVDGGRIPFENCQGTGMRAWCVASAPQMWGTCDHFDF